MSQPGAKSRVVLSLLWLVIGSAMVGVPVWLVLTRWPAILSGHPAMLVAVFASGLFGIVAVAWAIATLVSGARVDLEGDPEHPRYRTPAQLDRRARWRIVFAVPAILVSVLLVSILAYARPFVATDRAVQAHRSGDNVRLVERLGWYELVPARQDDAGNPIKPTTGLVVVPGARVDSRAYAALLRPIAEAGYFVAVTKEPFGMPIIDPIHASGVIDVHPEIRYWAVGGHSLGGVAAATVAAQDGRVTGLVLYASYPASPITRTGLKAVSISGTLDGLTTPRDIAESRSRLPKATTVVAIAGAVHSTFGDYGEQPGDGVPTVDHAAAQAQIAGATRALLASLTPPPAKKR